MNIINNADLSHLTTIKIGGRCHTLAFPETEEDIRYLINLSRDKDMPVYILGRGSNTIFGSIKGVVINMSRLRSTPIIKEVNNHIEVTLKGGNPLSELINISAEKNMDGVYRLYGFPATVGGAVSMNAGAYGYEISKSLKRIKFITWEGITEEAEVSDLSFGYRKSPFPHLGVVTEVTFELHPSATSVKEEIAKIKTDRIKKQPINMPTSGSTFKNPKEAPAGLLLEKSGVKGLRRGNVMFSRKHANFLINLGGGTFEDAVYLIKMAVEIVKNETGIVLEEEVRLVEDSGADGWKIL